MNNWINFFSSLCPITHTPTPQCLFFWQTLCIALLCAKMKIIHKNMINPFPCVCVYVCVCLCPFPSFETNILLGPLTPTLLLPNPPNASVPFTASGLSQRFFWEPNRTSWKLTAPLTCSEFYLPHSLFRLLSLCLWHSLFLLNVLSIMALLAKAY